MLIHRIYWEGKEEEEAKKIVPYIYPEERTLGYAKTAERRKLRLRGRHFLRQHARTHVQYMYPVRTDILVPREFIVYCARQARLFTMPTFSMTIITGGINNDVFSLVTKI
jgi:hypothetical protein